MTRVSFEELFGAGNESTSQVAVTEHQLSVATYVPALFRVNTFLMTPRKIIQHKSSLLGGNGGAGCHYGDLKAVAEGRLEN